MAQLGTIKLQTDSGIVDVPVFDVGDSGGSTVEALRVQTDSGEGFVPLVDPADAASPQEAIRVQTDSGIKAVTDSASVITIPDSVVLNATAESYDGSQFVSNIGPNIPDSNGNPSIIQDDINGFDAVKYQNSNDDKSLQSQTIANGDSIAVVATFRKSNLNDNGNVIDGESTLSFGLNDDSAGRDWIVFADGKNGQQKLLVNFSGSLTHDTNYHTYAYGIGSELFFSRDGSRIASDGSVTTADTMDGINIANTDCNMALTEISVLDDFTNTTDLNEEIARQRNKYGL